MYDSRIVKKRTHHPIGNNRSTTFIAPNLKYVLIRGTYTSARIHAIPITKDRSNFLFDRRYEEKIESATPALRDMIFAYWQNMIVV